MSATTLPAKANPAPAPARCCSICLARLPADSPARHRLCLTCWRWRRLGLALLSAKRWMEARP